MDDNLKALSRNQSNQSPAKRRSTMEWSVRIAPWASAVIVVVIGILLFGDRLLPAAEVQLETVVTLRDAVQDQSAIVAVPNATGNSFNGNALFQASGWFEAAPFPLRATALASGVVDKVHVLEGQVVRAGDPVATLISEDLELRLQAANANVLAARATVEETRSEHALAQARTASMRQQIQVAHSRRLELADLDARARELGPQVMAQQDIIQAELRLNTQDQTIAALEAQLRERLIETERWERKISVTESRLAQAEVEKKEAELAVARTVIRSPADGIIQRLLVSPGQKKLLMADNPESATVALIFQPGSMQARIDVPLAEAARLSVGQAVLLESEFLPGDELRGHVQRINGEADLQRNTLQAKVAIIDPPAGLRPEILCRARFLDTNIGTGVGESTQSGNTAARPVSGNRLRILVPAAAIIDRNLRQPTTWAVDASGRRLELRNLTLSGEERDGFHPVVDGLRPGDRVVVRPSAKLREGIRIKSDQ